MDANLLQCVGEYVLVHQLSDIAGNYPGMEKAQQRLPEALMKLSKLCLRYVLKRLFVDDFIGAKSYYHFSLAINPDISSDELFIEIERFWNSADIDKEGVLDELKAQQSHLVSRKVSYSVPDGSIPLLAH